MAFAKFEGNRIRIDGEIAENHAILVNLTATGEYKKNKRRSTGSHLQVSLLLHYKLQ